jgi:hypothetical protein
MIVAMMGRMKKTPAVAGVFVSSEEQQQRRCTPACAGVT